MSKIPQEAIEAVIKQWGYWYHKNELLVDRGDTPSDSEIDFEVEAWNAVKKVILVSADAARAQGAEVAVRPLEWKKGYCDEVVQIKNTSFGGSYQIRSLRGEIWVDWPHKSSTLFMTEEAAKAAAQADYEQRVRSALTAPPAPQPTDRKRVMGEILQDLVLAVDNDQNLGDIMRKVRAALTAPPAPQPTDREKVLEDAITEAIDLLMCRKLGSPARSPEHNARLKLQAALAGKAPSQTDRAEEGV